MAMAGVGHTDATRKIEVGLPILPINITPFATLGDDVRVSGPDGRDVENAFGHDKRILSR
jgi:hypothetical protein